MNTTATIFNTADLMIGLVTVSPLAHPLRRLAEDLNNLVQDGHIQGVELDLSHLDCPCFLLNVAPDKPLLYVELFLGDLDDGFEEDEEINNKAVPLCVLMNWLGSDTEPTYWETEWESKTCEPAIVSSEPECMMAPDFGEVLRDVLLIIEDQQKKS